MASYRYKFTLVLADVRTHPPLIASFPPLPSLSHENETTDSNVDTLIGSNTDSLQNGTTRPKDLVQPNPPGIDYPPSRTHSRRGSMAEPSSPVEPLLSLPNLLNKASQFVTLDDRRFNAFSPSARASFPLPQGGTSGGPQSPPQSPTGDMRLNRLPNARLDIEVSSLNIHLSLRVHEVMACAEAMWDFVKEYQQLYASRAVLNGVPQLLARGSKRMQMAPEPIHTSLVQMSRIDFNALLSHFEL